MPRYYFRLEITSAQYLSYYQGVAARVLVRAEDGRTLSLPAAHLRRFVAADGVRGRFCLTLDERQRILSLERQLG